jgi:metal-sulfur cluster biosynthetic enzyme
MRATSQRTDYNERRRIRRALLKLINEVIDPCSTVAGAPAGLVEFGLVRGVDLKRAETGGWNVGVRLMLTEPGCIMGGPFAVRVRDKLASFPALASLDVRIESVGMWSEASMSKAYATRLATARAGRVIPIAQHHAAEAVEIELEGLHALP